MTETKTERHLDSRADAKRRAWLTDPRLMLTELSANATFTHDNPGVAIIMQPAVWQLYADVMEAVLLRCDPVPSMTVDELEQYRDDFARFSGTLDAQRYEPPPYPSGDGKAGATAESERSGFSLRSAWRSARWRR